MKKAAANPGIAINECPIPYFEYTPLGRGMVSSRSAEKHDLRPPDFLRAVAASIVATPSDQVNREKQDENFQGSAHRAAVTTESDRCKSLTGRRRSPVIELPINGALVYDLLVRSVLG